MMLAEGQASTGPNQGVPALFSVSGAEFLLNSVYSDEIFGATSLIVRCRDLAELATIIESLEGQLTATLHVDHGDATDASMLIPTLESRAGRLIVNGWPTGVEVSAAMVHGGPFPATSDGRSTSVGTLAIDRFLRPLCRQGFPDWLKVRQR